VFVGPLQRQSNLGDDWLEPQQRRYSVDENRLWDELFERQQRLLPGRACQAFVDGLERLDLGRGGVPSFERVNESLPPMTGWQVVPVPMLIPDAVFFYHLANRRFPVGNFIRTRDQFDYVQEPDVFHDLFGHVPLLTDPVLQTTWLPTVERVGRRSSTTA
jgi:phenylalanine-4-hydroxylase